MEWTMFELFHNIHGCGENLPDHECILCTYIQLQWYGADWCVVDVRVCMPGPQSKADQMHAPSVMGQIRALGIFSTCMYVCMYVVELILCTHYCTR